MIPIYPRRVRVFLALLALVQCGACLPLARSPNACADVAAVPVAEIGDMVCDVLGGGDDCRAVAKGLAFTADVLAKACALGAAMPPQSTGRVDWAGRLRELGAVPR